jgi:dGTPase
LILTAPAGRPIGPQFIPPAARAAFATQPAESRGRLYPEEESATRTCFQRDRDRIIHSTAFRRLKHKTQVFIQGEGDYFRTRMTHSLEVAQIARTVARVLALDEDLAETVALAHDLGHTPFGHTGEEALSAATADIGGFDHNAHALRLVARLEHRYAAFDGLNLTWETLEGLVKHNGPVTTPPIPAPIARFDAVWPLDLHTWPGLEAQIAAQADDIAYLNHDIDDGLRAGLFGVEELAEAPLAGDAVREVQGRFGHIELGRTIGELVRVLMGEMTGDLLIVTRENLARVRPGSAAEVRTGSQLAAFSPGLAKRVAALKQFLFFRMYRHPRVVVSREKQKKVVGELFAAYAADPGHLPRDWAMQCGAPHDAATAGIVRDYIAGMTDSFALQEYKRIFHSEIAL